MAWSRLKAANDAGNRRARASELQSAVGVGALCRPEFFHHLFELLECRGAVVAFAEIDRSISTDEADKERGSCTHRQSARDTPITVYAHRAPTDMRKGFDRLCGMPSSIWPGIR